MKTNTYNLAAAGVLAALGLGIAGAQADTNPVCAGDWRSYAVYDPNVTLVSIHHGGTNISDPKPREYNSCASVKWFDGRFYCVWNHSPTTFSEGDMTAQWEPYFFEQADGALRMFSRNLQQSKRPGLSYPPPTELLFTAVGSGASKGEPVTFSPDANYSHMEVNDSRPVVMKLESGRYRVGNPASSPVAPKWAWRPERATSRAS